MFGAEMVVLEGNEGDVGVDGLSEVDGDNIGCWECSSARTTSAGVPLVDQTIKRRVWRLRFPDTLVDVVVRSVVVLRCILLSDSTCEDRAPPLISYQNQMYGREY